jgi:hypothetical protein
VITDCDQELINLTLNMENNNLGMVANVTFELFLDLKSYHVNFFAIILNAILHCNINFDFQIRLQMQIENPLKVNEYVTINDRTVNACDILKYMRSNFLVKTIFDDFYAKANFKEICPIDKVEKFGLLISTK